LADAQAGGRAVQIYGGRDMKSYFRGAGGINLKGRKSHALSCGCCDMFNFKDKYFERLARSEMREAVELTSTCAPDQVDVTPHHFPVVHQFEIGVKNAK
jgi:hypothetical protein